MGIENLLLGAYTIGTQDEIHRYVDLNPSSHRSNLGYAFWVEFGLAALSKYVLPDTVENYVAIPLFADLTVRWGAGIYNTIRNYTSAKRSHKPIHILDAINPIPQTPGIVGRVRELVQKVL